MPFTVLGVSTGQNFLWTGAGITASFNNRVNLFADYTALVSNRDTIQMGCGGLQIWW